MRFCPVPAWICVAVYAVFTTPQAVYAQEATPPATPPKVSFALSDTGALSIHLGDHALLEKSMPRVEHFDLDQGETIERPESQWMTRAQPRYGIPAQELTCDFEWGSVAIVYDVTMDRTRMNVRIHNKTDKPLVGFHLALTDAFTFPSTPKGQRWQKGWPVTADANRPAVVYADFGSGALAACTVGRQEGEQIGFVKNHIQLKISRIPAGETHSTYAAVRVGPGSDRGEVFDLGDDIYKQYAKAHPMIVDWPDRRPIAALHPSSSHLGAAKVGNTTNPRGWIVGSGKHPVDITTDEGRARFREQMLTFARNSVKVCKGMNAQGMINWSLEGQEWPHAISYLGDPTQLAAAAPEMDAIADEWFKVFTDAGLRVGVCIRPQQLTEHAKFDPDSPPNQPPWRYQQAMLWDNAGRIDDDAIIELLDKKLTYAKERWGCTLFYVDSNVGSKWAKDDKTGKWRNVYWVIHSGRIYRELTKRHPDCLIMPEHEYFSYWGGSAPIGETPPEVQRVWPNAFAVNLMQHFKYDDPADVKRHEAYVRRGDILLFHGWYNAPANAVIKGIYETVYGDVSKARRE